MRDFSDIELKELLENDSPETASDLAAEADALRRQYYSDEVYIRGLIEFSNYCKNNCYYCGIRGGNTGAVRYRLAKEEILSCCQEGYDLGFRTFVLQSGEDPYFSDEKICGIVAAIRHEYPDCAITLSIGEKTRESYQAYFDAGANRYLLRHETASEEHYGKLHPKEMSASERKRCLFDLKEIGYQVGSGFMVGSPFQTTEHLIQDLRFLQELEPDMIGIGPYISHGETPFAGCVNGTLSQTLRLVSILRLMFPYALIPATTALGTIHPRGREWGLQAGANVVMPNLSPMRVRKLYDLYENKISTGEEAAQSVDLLKKQVVSAGYRVVEARGDVKRDK
ncbi:MAG: [FeFe] hydrogenase H-cluster radical SAM maturase HydE [Eubacterium sp.]|nr:[FeFe] hydrogenase H-cluster radical SAM maturase HydE [Eubacterium sp.]